MSGDEIRKILCGVHKVPAEVRGDPNGEMAVTCPACGQSDSFEEATREAIGDFTRKMIGEALGFGTRKTGNVTITGPAQSNGRWIFGEAE